MTAFFAGAESQPITWGAAGPAARTESQPMTASPAGAESQPITPGAAAWTESQPMTCGAVVAATAVAVKESRAVRPAAAIRRAVRDMEFPLEHERMRWGALLRSGLSALAWGGAPCPAVPVNTILLGPASREKGMRVAPK